MEFHSGTDRYFEAPQLLCGAQPRPPRRQCGQNATRLIKSPRDAAASFEP